MKVTINRFGTAAAVALALAAIALFFVDFTMRFPHIDVRFLWPFDGFFVLSRSRGFRLLLFAAPLTFFLLLFSSPKNVRPALLVPACCFVVGWTQRLIYCLLVTEHLSAKALFFLLVSAFVLLITILFSTKVSDKTVCAVFIFLAAAAPVALGIYLILSRSLYSGFLPTALVHIFTFAAMGLAVCETSCNEETANVSTSCLPPEPEVFAENAEIAPEAVSPRKAYPSLTEALDCLEQKLNSGEISEEEYEKLKEEALWKI